MLKLSLTLNMSPLDKRRNSEIIHKLEARIVFHSLTDDTHDETLLKPYTHHLARACWNGSRIVLRQTSQEAEGISTLLWSYIVHATGDGTILGSRHRAG